MVTSCCEILLFPQRNFPGHPPSLHQCVVMLIVKCKFLQYANVENCMKRLRSESRFSSGARENQIIFRGRKVIHLIFDKLAWHLVPRLGQFIFCHHFYKKTKDKCHNIKTLTQNPNNNHSL